MSATTCKTCGLPKFDGAAGYCGPQCKCDFKTLPQMYDERTAEIATLREQLTAANTEVARLNKWADGFSDAQLIERAACEEVIRELREQLEAYKGVKPADGAPDPELFVLRYTSTAGTQNYLTSNVGGKLQHRYVLASDAPLSFDTETIDKESDTDFQRIGGSEGYLLCCALCDGPAQLWQRHEGGDNYSKAGMCSNDDCPLYLPGNDFHKATKKEAIEYWNVTRSQRGAGVAVSKPISDNRIASHGRLVSDFYSFKAGVRFAEAEHGVGSAAPADDAQQESGN
jgi:uncharacterized Zn finger protein (UPF0148 family)